MKLTLDAFNAGMARFISERLAPEATSTWMKFLLGAAGACAPRLEEVLPAPVLQASGILSADGLVDTERLGMALKGGFKAQETVTVAGLLRFTAADAEAFLRYIESPQ